MFVCLSKNRFNGLTDRAPSQSYDPRNKISMFLSLEINRKIRKILSFTIEKKKRRIENQNLNTKIVSKKESLVILTLLRQILIS